MQRPSSRHQPFYRRPRGWTNNAPLQRSVDLSLAPTARAQPRPYVFLLEPLPAPSMPWAKAPTRRTRPSRRRGRADTTPTNRALEPTQTNPSFCPSPRPTDWRIASRFSRSPRGTHAPRCEHEIAGPLRLVRRRSRSALPVHGRIPASRVAPPNGAVPLERPILGPTARPRDGASTPNTDTSSFPVPRPGHPRLICSPVG